MSFQKLNKLETFGTTNLIKKNIFFKSIKDLSTFHSKNCLEYKTILKKLQISIKDIKKLEFLSNNLFSSRRKKLKNKIESLFDIDTIENNNLKKYFDLRAENLDREAFYTLTRLLK